jgi:integrase
LKGFGIKVTPSGAKTYVYQFRIGGRSGRTRRVTIGKHGAPYTPDRARQEAEKHAYAVKHQQIDPQAAKLALRNDAVALAFDTYAERFIAEYLPDKWVRFQDEGARLLRREAVPHFRGIPLPAISKRDVTELFDKLKPRVGVAKNTSTVLRKMFNWAVERGELHVSPMDRIALPKSPALRRRYLNDAELRALWLASLDLGHPYGRLIRALILLGQRRDEVGAMTWDEVDVDTATWTLPGGRAKNAKDHTVPLSSQAMRELKATGTAKGFLFSVSGDRPVQNWSYWKRRIDPLFAAQMKDANLPPPAPWTLHDLRRSVATGLQRLGEHEDWIEAFQNRAVREGSAKHYQHHHYKEEMRTIAQRWADHIDHVLGQKPVCSA